MNSQAEEMFDRLITHITLMIFLGFKASKMSYKQ